MFLHFSTFCIRTDITQSMATVSGGVHASSSRAKGVLRHTEWLMFGSSVDRRVARVGCGRSWAARLMPAMQCQCHQGPRVIQSPPPVEARLYRRAYPPALRGAAAASARRAAPPHCMLSPINIVLPRMAGGLVRECSGASIARIQCAQAMSNVS